LKRGLYLGKKKQKGVILRDRGSI